ncbi:MAG: hypothetical protein HFJ10_00985 [Lachnospiraceae bacterium]|nr:hypothetical protein [Lachnospiraceae bacterium]
MKKTDIKSSIDWELKELKLNEGIKSKIRSASMSGKSGRISAWKSIAASILVAILGGTTVYAGYHMLNKVQINEEVLPELNPMQMVQIKELDTPADEYGIVKKDFSDYMTLKDDLGVHLLDTHLSLDNPYMQCQVMTDTENFAIVTVEHFILGDTSNYQWIVEENRYSYDNGSEYFSPVSLTADLILSESQMVTGWETDYLGLYQFVENYTSGQGYSVNLLEDTILEKDLENYVSEKVAIFVADGIRYTLKGRVSTDTIKAIVDTMK